MQKNLISSASYLHPYILGGLFPLPPPDGFPVALGALTSPAIVASFYLMTLNCMNKFNL